ncbi:MAG: SpoIIE family protein phosphatase [Armatimonadetes bacterium]|nr:SpoIIE family protein phosphatase [Armatimonadota bacterium]
MSYGVVHRPKPGNSVSGDCWWVLERPGRTLVGLADGLGSGPAAASAAERAAEVTTEHADLPLPDILDECDRELQNTRGAAVGLLAVYTDERLVEYAGVGNVEVRTTWNSGFKPVSTNGIVGANYRSPRIYRGEYREGETIVLHSDGLRTAFDLDQELQRADGAAQSFADRLADSYGRELDDVTVLVLQLG